jgi:hypothetical protein
MTAMTKQTGNTMDLKRLEAALETYGADRTRWPAPLRRELSGVIAGNGEAERLVAEAAALDRLLDLAPKVAESRQTALSDRIVRTAKISAPVTVVPLRPAALRPRDSIYAGFALAASLMLGVVTGSQASLAPAMQDVAMAVGLDAGSDGGQVAVNDDGLEIVNEELL